MRRPHISRRQFLHHSSTALAWPAALNACATRMQNAQDPWAQAHAEFLIPADRIYLNIGTLGPQPRIVVDAVIEHTRRVAMSLPPGVDWDTLKRECAALLNCDPAGLVFPRNTTEGMNFVANGLELNAGDEVITTNHEHIGGLCCWQLIAKRRGVTLRQVELQNPPLDPQAAYDAIVRAISSRTKVVSVSHVNFTNGLNMPVRALIEYCRPRGIIVVVDGAHPPGLMAVDLRALDPDFYATSPHKWLFAAQGTGLLYLRDEWRTKLWPTLASGDWDNLTLGAQRFNHLGSFDESRLAGLLAAVRFHQALGPDRTYARIRHLRSRIFDALAQSPRVHFTSPRNDSAGAGMVSFTVDGITAQDLQRKLAEHNVRTRVIGEYNYNWMRLSASVHSTEAQIERVASLIGSA
ncbi:MAG: aminotransferase class V-fold PLP-dependent enzyme [Longimicrobiales bacterium]